MPEFENVSQNQVQPTIIFLKCPVPSQENGYLLHYSSFLCVLHFSIVFLLCRSSPLIFDVFPSVLV